MQAGKKSLGQIFANDQQNVIPRYQRPYVWSQEKNWEPLWQDIREAAEDVEEVHGSGSPVHEGRTYFLGALVVQTRKTTPEQILSWNVVDGQQRLTTLQVIFASARSVAIRLEAKSLAAKFASLITNNPDIIDEKFPNDRYKVWPLPQDRDVFLWAVRGPGEDSPSPAPDHLIELARKWFEQEIAEWAAESITPVDRLQVLHQTLKDRMELVQINLEAHDDPQVIFEVLNHRGVPLDAADLVKNLLFQSLDAHGHYSQADELLVNNWLPLDTKPWREDVTTGRVRRKRIDVLLSYWLMIRTGHDVVIEHLFADFKKWLHDTGNDADEAIQSIRHHADTMLKMIALPYSDPTTQLLDRMDATQTTTPWPLLLHLYADSRIPADQRSRAAKAIDSFLMRRAVCRLSTKDYNRLFLQVLGNCTLADPERAGVVVEESLLRQTADSRIWPSDGAFAESLTQPNVYNLLLRARVKALLVGVENYLRTGGKAESGLLKSGDQTLNLEHLMPQSWEKNWPLSALPTEHRYGEQLVARRSAIHRLGNLTLTTTKLNPSLGNKAWSKKRADIHKYSLLLLTTMSVLSMPDESVGMSDDAWAADWDEQRITIRGEWLARQALSAWPKPTYTPSASDDNV